jgi:hypothetical protein
MMCFSDQDKMLKIVPNKEEEGSILGGMACVGNKYDDTETARHVQTE